MKPDGCPIHPFNEGLLLYLHELKHARFASLCSGADANTAYDKFEHQISQVVDKHAPIKQAYQRRKKLPCMNSNLKKAIFLKKRFFNEYKKNSNSKTWEKYRAQRNLVNKIKKKSVSTYFQERCVGGTKSDNFWKTIKPYLSKKNTSGPSKVILTENSKLKGLFTPFFKCVYI